MDVFTKLFGNLLAFVYHCFDRIVIHGYLSALSRPEQVVHFVRRVVGVPVVSKEILSQRTADYQNWVEAYARNHHTPIEWAEKGVRKEDHVRPWLRRRGLRCDSGPSSRSRRWYRFPLYGLVQDPHHGPALRRADRQGPAARHRRSRLRTGQVDRRSRRARRGRRRTAGCSGPRRRDGGSCHRPCACRLHV
jgi:hypothetical protein